MRQLKIQLARCKRALFLFCPKIIRLIPLVVSSSHLKIDHLNQLHSLLADTGSNLAAALSLTTSTITELLSSFTTYANN
jgi:hypothetical protein